MLDKQRAVGLAKPADRPDHEVDDPIYVMTLKLELHLAEGQH